MATENDRVEDVERVMLPGSEGAPEDDDEAGEDEGADEGEEGADDGAEGEEGAAKPPVRKPQEQIVKKPEPPAGTEGADAGAAGGTGGHEPKPVEGETPRERALRFELEGTRKKLRDQMGGDIKLGEGAPAPAKKEPSPEVAAILKKYKPEEIAALREVFPALAAEMGFVKTAELSAQHYAESSQEVLDQFLNEHKEYMPENDKDGLLWKRFGEEFKMYRQPENPKEYRKIFNRIHIDIFGIKPAGDKGAVTAAQKKITVASHAGASGPTRNVVTTGRPKGAPGAYRLDMLKGFSDEEKADMIGGDEEE